MKKKWYNLLVALTFILPMSVYLVLVATVFQIKTDAIVYGKTEQVEVVEDMYLYAYALTEDVSFNGKVVYKDGDYALKFELDEIIKFDNGYFRYDLDDITWVDVKLFELQQARGYKIPLAIIFSGLGAVIVGLVISNKMQWHKKKPRLATFLALLTGTLVLLVLNTIIGSILGVFAVATASFGLYCIEYLVQSGKLQAEDTKKVSNELTNLLEDTIRKLKQ